MTPEEVAKRYAYHRGDHELVGYAEVGLPVYRLTIRAFTLEHKKIPPIEEFVLKAIKHGLVAADNIAQFLGLKETIIKSALTNLIRSEDVALSGTAESLRHTLRLTANGERTLKEAELLRPEEGTFQIYFDGLLRRPEYYPRELFYAPKEIRENGMMEIRASPSRSPEVSDLPLKDVERIIRRLGRGTEAKRDLISITGIERRSRLFRHAVALTFRARDTNEIQVAVAVDGRLDEEYENALARICGGSKLGLERHLFNATARSPIELLPEGLASLLPAQDEVERIKAGAVSAQAKLATAKGALACADTAEARTSAQEMLRDAEQQVGDANRTLDAFPVRYLSVYEHPEILQKAFEVSCQRLLIISPWITSKVVDGQFRQTLEILLRRGVRVYIGYGIGDEGRKKKLPADEDAEKRLQRLAKQYVNFKFKYIGNTHAKVLLYDSACAVVTSFNWLSFRGDRSMPYRDERGVLITLPRMVDKIFDEEMGRFAETPKESGPDKSTPASAVASPVPMPQVVTQGLDHRGHPAAPPVVEPEKPDRQMKPTGHSVLTSLPEGVSKRLEGIVQKSGKMRVYDLAKALKLDNKRVMEDARREGVDVRVPSNTVPNDVTRRICDKYYPAKAKPLARQREQKSHRMSDVKLPVNGYERAKDKIRIRQLAQKLGLDTALIIEAAQRQGCKVSAEFDEIPLEIAERISAEHTT